MASGAILGAALQGATPAVRSLFVGGLDVLREPGAAGGTAYGTVLGSVEVREAGPGGVSSLEAEVDDPSSELSFTDGVVVSMWDQVNDWPIFTGFLDNYSALPAFGGTGRVWKLSAIGVEAVLDWMVIPEDLTFPAGPTWDIGEVVQALCGQALGVGVPLRTGSAGISSSIEFPVVFEGATLAAPLEVKAGDSLREAIRKAVACIVAPDTRFTVDQYYGLRIDSLFSGVSSLSLNDGTGGTLKMANLEYAIDATAPRAVFITGANAAGTGLVGDGSGRPGAIAQYSDDTIDTADKLLNAGRAYLAEFAPKLRGSFDLEDVDPAALQFAGVSRFCALSSVFLTVASIGITAEAFDVFGITRKFGPTLDTLTVEFGGLAPRMTSAMRRLTREARA